MRIHQITLLAFLTISSSANASILFSASGTNTFSGNHLLAATASFNVVGNQLTIVLTNTSTQAYSSANRMVPSDVLTSVFFDLTGKPAGLTLASITGSGFVQNTTTPTDLRAPDAGISPGLDGGYQFRFNPNGLGGNGTGNQLVSQSYGIGTAGLDIFQGNKVNGTDYGIVNNNYTGPTLGNNGMNDVPLVRNSITITLANLPVGFSLSSVSNVRFQYGTGLNETQLIPPPSIIVVPVPEPSSITGAAFGIAACLLGLRRATAPARPRNS